MGTTTVKRTDLITSLEDLSIYRFDKCINGDIQYLYKEYENKEVDNDIKELWIKLYTEYSNIIDNTSALYLYILASEINYLEAKQRLVAILCKTILKIDDKELQSQYIDEIKQWGFKIDVTKPIFEEIEIVSSILKNVNTKYKRKLSEYEDLTKDNDKKISIYDQKVKLENMLKLHIDIKVVNVMEWIAYWKEVERMIKTKNNGK